MLGFLLAAVHFLSEELEEHIRVRRDQVVSFSSGVSITYIFVQLLPEFNQIALESSELVFIFPLLGFSSIHLLEKYVAKAGLGEKEMRKDYGEIHSAFLFFYHGAIGYLIASLLVESTISGLLFFIPVVLHIAVSSFSMTELHESFFQKKTVKIGISIAPVIGVLLHQFGNISTQHFNPVFGTVVGMFFYVVIRDSMPDQDRGQPLEYIIGAIAYLAIILAANTV